MTVATGVVLALCLLSCWTAQGKEEEQQQQPADQSADSESPTRGEQVPGYGLPRQPEFGAGPFGPLPRQPGLGQPRLPQPVLGVQPGLRQPNLGIQPSIRRQPGIGKCTTSCNTAALLSKEIF